MLENGFMWQGYGEGSVKNDTKVSGLCNLIQRGITGGEVRVEVLGLRCLLEASKRAGPATQMHCS